MDQQAAPVRTAGPAASLRALGATLVEIVGTRAELALVELREEGERRREAAILAAVAGVALSLAVLLGTFLVIAFFWETHRLAAIGAMGALYLAIAGGAFAIMRAKAAASPPPFEATLRELVADRDLLRGGARKPSDE